MDGGLWHWQAGGDQNHPQEKEMQKAKWLSEEAEKRREAKGKVEKERYIIWMQSSKKYQGEIRKSS